MSSEMKTEGIYCCDTPEELMPSHTEAILVSYKQTSCFFFVFFYFFNL